MSERPADREPRPGAADGILRIGSPGLAELARAILMTGRPVRFRVSGSSMLPSLRDGDVIRVGPPGRPYERGDVAAFVTRPDGPLLVHRLQAAAGGLYRFKGDNAARCDPPVAAEGVIGLVWDVERGGRPVRYGGRGGRRLAAALSRAGAFRAVLALRWRILRLLGRRRADG